METSPVAASVYWQQPQPGCCEQRERPSRHCNVEQIITQRAKEMRTPWTQRLWRALLGSKARPSADPIPTAEAAGSCPGRAPKPLRSGPEPLNPSVLDQVSASEPELFLCEFYPSHSMDRSAAGHADASLNAVFSRIRAGKLLTALLLAAGTLR